MRKFSDIVSLDVSQADGKYFDKDGNEISRLEFVNAVSLAMGGSGDIKLMTEEEKALLDKKKEDEERQKWRCRFNNPNCFKWFDEEKQKPCGCAITQNWNKKMWKLQHELPKKHFGISWDAFDKKIYKNPKNNTDLILALKASKAYVNNYLEHYEHGEGLFIWSNSVGSGKTMLSSIIAQEIQNLYGHVATFSSLPSMFANIQDTYQGESQLSTFEVEEHYFSADILLIDDWGRERGTPWEHSKAFELIRKRYDANKPTIVTSNMDFDELIARGYSDSAIDRLIERSIVIKMPEKSVRAVIGKREREARSK